MKQRPYAGNGRPFVYAQFAPEDRESEETVLNAMGERGYEVWPSEKSDVRRMGKSALALFFLSPDAAKSEEMNRSMSHAAQRNLPMLVVYLSPTKLTPAQQLLLNTQQAILRSEHGSDEAFFKKLFGSGMLQKLQATRAQKRAARLTTYGIIGGVLAAAALAVILVLSVHTDVPEHSLLADLGFSGSLSNITSIYLYGSAIEPTRSDQVICSTIFERAENRDLNTVFYNDLNNATAFGDIDDITDFSQLYNLKELSIAGNRVEDISALYPLRKLEFLDLSGNPIDNIDGIGTMPRLKTICIGGTQITDISALDDCKRLEQLYVDPKQYHVFSAEETRHRFSITPIGPRQELANLSCHIFGGPDEGCLYGLYVKTKSSNVYEDYTYEFYKNDLPIFITGRSYEDSIMDKTHMLIDEAAMGRYDPASVYTLIVTYGSCSAAYRLWHYQDQRVAHANVGTLVETTGLLD